MIKRPKKVERSQRNYMSNEKYQDYAESQFKTIYDYLDERAENVLEPTVVYKNELGNNGNATFDESIIGAKEIEIVYFYSTTQKIYKSVKVPYTENMKISLDIHYYGVGSVVYFIFAHLIQISNNGITKIYEYSMNFANSWSKPSIESSTDIYIEKVIVYK